MLKSLAETPSGRPWDDHPYEVAGVQRGLTWGVVSIVTARSGDDNELKLPWQDCSGHSAGV